MPSGSDWHSKKMASKKRWNPRPGKGPKTAAATSSSTLTAKQTDSRGRGKSRDKKPGRGGGEGGSAVAAGRNKHHTDTGGAAFSRRKKTDNSHRYQSDTNGFSFRLDGRHDDTLLQAISAATSASEEKVAARSRSQPRSRQLTHLTASERELASLQFLCSGDAVACADEAARSYDEQISGISKLGLAYLLDIDDVCIGFKAQWDQCVDSQSSATADEVPQSNAGAAAMHECEAPKLSTQSNSTKMQGRHENIQPRADGADGDVDAMIGAGGGSRALLGTLWSQDHSAASSPPEGDADADVDALLALDDGADAAAILNAPVASVACNVDDDVDALLGLADSSLDANATDLEDGSLLKLESVHNSPLDSADGHVDALLALDTGDALDDASSHSSFAAAASSASPAAQDASVDALLGGTDIHKCSHVKSASSTDDDVDALLKFSSTASSGTGGTKALNVPDIVGDDADADVDALLGL